MEIKDYVIDKFFLPKVVIIDKPGMIISKTTRGYGKPSSRKRLAFHFEDIFVQLQLDTIDKLGLKKSSELFYRIGRDIGIRQILLARAAKPGRYLVNTTIKIVLNQLKGSGVSLAKEVSFDPGDDTISLKGEDNLVCRKSKNPHFWRGILASILGFLLDSEVSIDFDCSKCPDRCVAVVKKAAGDSYRPDLNKLRPLRRYEPVNYQDIKPGLVKITSIGELYKFKKLHLDKKGKLNYKEFTLFPTEHGQLELVAEHYREAKLLGILEGAIRPAAARISSKLIKGKDIDEKLSMSFRLISALGWGVPHYRLNGNKASLTIINAPITRYGYLYHALVMNGFLNNILNKSLSIEDLRVNDKEGIIKISYSE